MEFDMWNVLDNIKSRSGPTNNKFVGTFVDTFRTESEHTKKDFAKNYCHISDIVHSKMYSKDVGDMFCEYVGADDGHDDLCAFIIWNGKATMTNFIRDPSSVIILAERMSDHPGFNGDTNVIHRAIYSI